MNDLTRPLSTLKLIILSSAVVSASGFRSGPAAAADDDLAVFVTKPISSTMILPGSGTDFLPGKPSREITMVATPGEYEPASFVLHPSQDIHALEIRATDLMRHDGKIIPASCVDVKAVKCWYQAEGAWKTISRRSFRKVLVPELLLNDDTLVKVNPDKRENYLRFTRPSGEEYVCITERPEVTTSPQIHFLGPGIGPTVKEDFIIRDSPRLQPLDIRSGINKQFWVTVHVPEDAVPGAYTGTIQMSSRGRTEKELTLRLKVLPFTLSEPKTYYDLNREFISSIYYRGVLDPKGRGAVFSGMLDSGGIGDLKSEDQFRAELTNMYNHGVTKPSICIGYSFADQEKDTFRDMLKIRREVGITGPFSMVFELVADQQNEASLEQLRVRAKELMDITKEFDIPGFYFYGIDEATGERLQSQRQSWQVIHDVGGKIKVAGGEGTFRRMGDMLDVFVWNNQPLKKEADKWHSVGHQIWSYSNPQGGVENPELYRRNYGFALWKSEYDGASTYCYQEENGGWNDFNGHIRDHNFTYATSDGVIDTISWEGYREAIDDIRYGTTLKEEIKKARTGQSERKRRVAERAEAFLENFDPRDDLDGARSKVIGYILQLRGPEDGLIAYWNFDDGKGHLARDRSGQGNHGVVRGATWIPGKVGSALQFDGIDDSVLFGNDPILNLNEAITVEGWIKWTGDYTGRPTEWGGLCKREQFLFYGMIREADPKLQFSMKVYNGRGSGFEPGANTGYIYELNKWYHVAGTYDNDRVKIYVDGELIQEEEKYYGPRFDSPPDIGKWGIWFHGAMDELKIYNRALSPSEIADHWHTSRRE